MTKKQPQSDMMRAMEQALQAKLNENVKRAPSLHLTFNQQAAAVKTTFDACKAWHDAAGNKAAAKKAYKNLRPYVEALADCQVSKKSPADFKALVKAACALNDDYSAAALLQHFTPVCLSERLQKKYAPKP